MAASVGSASSVGSAIGDDAVSDASAGEAPGLAVADDDAVVPAEVPVSADPEHAASGPRSRAAETVNAVRRGLIGS